MKNCDNPNIPCINRIAMCTATACVKTQQHISPLTIEINEGLFHKVERHGHYIKFICATGTISIGKEGDSNTFGIILSAQALNEIIRVRAALGWTGKE